MRSIPRFARGRRRAAGFSLAELVVTLAVFGVIVVGLLNVFDFTSRLTRTQLQISELQQSHRIAQQELLKMARMAGRGGLATSPPLDQTNVALFPANGTPAHTTPAVEVIDNAPDAAAQAALGWPYVARAGTDTLVVRGVLTTPLYVISSWDPTAWNDAGRTVTVPTTTPDGMPQNVQPLLNAIAAAAAGQGEAIILVSALNQAIYGVAQLTGGINGGATITLNFTDSRAAGSTARTIDYSRLSSGGTFPTMIKVGYVGILEEYRYYVRDAVLDGRPWPSLSRARVYPMPTNRSSAANPVAAWANAATNLQDDFADGVFDLQVAAGFDSSLLGRLADDVNNDGADDQIGESVNGQNDDWLFNAAADTPTVTPWIPGPSRLWTANAPGGLNPRPSLYYLRISTLTRTERQDRGYLAPLLQRIENRTYATDAADPINGTDGRRYRRQLLQTIVDLRNAA